MNNQGKKRFSALVMITVLLLTSISCARINQPVPAPVSTPVPTTNIVIDDSIFSPADIIVETGTSITWTNCDKISYFIEDNDQQFAFTSPADGSFSLSFPEIGTFSYCCRIHPYMQGTIIVVNGASV